jgi:hypothetical protein
MLSGRDCAATSSAVPPAIIRFATAGTISVTWPVARIRTFIICIGNTFQDEGVKTLEAALPRKQLPAPKN